MLYTKKEANAMSAKTVRACDSCVKKRARWYCAADDAFLCQSCDSSVHSANPLARRHIRVRLKTASFKSSSGDDDDHDDHVPLVRFSPSWERGFTRKARSRRSVKGSVKAEHNNPFPNVVPEVLSFEENDEAEQLLYRVPIYDPFVAELCTSTSGDVEVVDAAATRESKAHLVCDGQDADGSHGLNFPSEMDLAEFAADVQSLLDKGLENESFAIEELGLMDTKEENFNECSIKSGRVKVEDNDNEEPFELSFNYDSPRASRGVEDEIVEVKKSQEDENEAKTKKRKTLLSLNYESVISAWAAQGSPWTSGGRPDFDQDDQCWPDYTGNGTLIGTVGHRPAMGDGGREARVSRYREKRRTRLFSKKIRYEVRKLNAEKRPRMKGRFVKKTSFLAGTVFPLINKK